MQMLELAVVQLQLKAGVLLLVVKLPLVLPERMLWVSDLGLEKLTPSVLLLARTELAQRLLPPRICLCLQPQMLLPLLLMLLMMGGTSEGRRRGGCACT